MVTKFSDRANRVLENQRAMREIRRHLDKMNIDPDHRLYGISADEWKTWVEASKGCLDRFAEIIENEMEQ